MRMKLMFDKSTCPYTGDELLVWPIRSCVEVMAV